MTLAIIFLATIAALILIILVVVVFIVSFSRRRDPLSDRRQLYSR